MEHLIKALACIKGAQENLSEFKGRRDFLEDVSEKLEEAKSFIKDTIELNA